MSPARPPGFYILDTEAIAHHKDADLAAGTAGCNLRSTIVSAGGATDPPSFPRIANDCVHMVVNNDPGLKAFLASNASPQAKLDRYLVMMTRSRFDVYPPVNATPTGTHSAVFVPDRPAQVNGNTKNRPAYVWVTDENGGCPLNYARMVSVESEIVPIMVGAFSIPDNQLDDCLEQAITEPSGERRRPGRAAESQSDGFQESGVQYVVRTRPARDRHLDTADAARSGLHHECAARHRQDVSGFQGRADLLGGQPHRDARREIHRAARERNARAGFGRLRGERDEPAPLKVGKAKLKS